MLELRILSHAQLEAYARDEHASDFIAIVIYSNGRDIPYIEDNPHMLGLLFEQFDDTDDENGISTLQAEEIAAFVQDYRESEEDIVISCQYGESRSAGIACAIAAYLGYDEMAIWGNPRKIPNMRCYAAMCRAFGIARSEDELRELFLFNTHSSGSR